MVSTFTRPARLCNENLKDGANTIVLDIDTTQSSFKIRKFVFVCVKRREASVLQHQATDTKDWFSINHFQSFSSILLMEVTMLTSAP